MLANDTRLGAYEVVETLGAGGMGEVYRARDTKLHREVAIKLLSGKLAPHAERLARFEREAHLLASINHPNIATIHGLEEAAGEKFLVLELVEGETLAERIAKGPIPLEQAFPLFDQIARGLEAAHEKGIVHRDLKPANIKITPDGRVKILDFGLGKVFEESDAGQVDVSHSPTITRGATREGVILGTAAYMSPEQARSEAVDKRTDIWAFGCCLYEALTGKPAFSGKSVVDILASVVKTEPDWKRLPADIPFLVRHILKRCLEKEAGERFHDIADARIDLHDASSTAVVVGEGETRRATSRLPYIVFAVALVVLGWLASSLRERPPTSPPVTRLELETGRLNVFASSLALSRDGAKLAYVSDDGQIYVRNLDRDVSIPLPETLGGNKPIFSPDGEWIAYHDSPSGKLKKTRSTGGSAVTLADWTRGTGFGVDWESEDTIVFADGDGIYRVSANGGERQRLEVTAPRSEDAFLYPRSPNELPGGKALLATSGTFLVGANLSLYRLDTGERQVLIENAKRGRYVPTGNIVFIRNDTLYAVGFDLDRLAVEGEPVPVLEDIQISVANGSTQYDFSENGTLAYVPAQWKHYRRKLVWVDRSGVVEPIHSIPRRIAGPQISPRGENIVLTVYDGTRPGLWLTEVARETLTPLIPGAWGYAARWSPDGKRLAFIGNSENQLTLFTASLGTAAPPEKVAPGINNIAWSPDGNALAYQAWGRESIFDTWTVSLEGDRTPRPYLEGPYLQGTPDFSPDGRWIAYVSAESGGVQIYVQPFGKVGPKHQISTDGGMEPLWSPDGTEIFYRSGRRMMAVEIETEPSFRASSPRMLFEGDFLRNDIHGWVRNHDISPDGKRFLMIQSEEEPVFTKIKIVLSWFDELKRLVPTDD